MKGGWLVRAVANEAAGVRLFCFPYAGVGASVYRQWVSELPSSVDVCSVQLPGRESRWNEPLLTRIDAIIAAFLPALLPHLDRPFAFFGHSMGGLIATEVVRALHQRGGPLPEHVFVSSRRAPHVPDPDPPLSGMSDARFIAEIQRRYGGIPAEVLRDGEMMALLLPVLRADVEAIEGYPVKEGLRIPCPLTVFGGNQDSRVPLPHLEAWRDVADAHFRMRIFEGGHFYITQRRSELLADIAATLGKNQLSSPEAIRGPGDALR